MRLLCVLALWATLPAVAACPPTATAVPEDMDARSAALHQLDSHIKACAGDASWHAQRGSLLLSLNRNEEAAESLEHALLLDPNYAGARIDYADALAKLGDTHAATLLASSLLALPELPTHARRHLEHRLQAWQHDTPGAPSRWQTRIELSPQIGWERNLNGGPAADTILLTPPEGPVSLPVASTQRPRAGTAMQTSGEIQALRPLPDDWALFVRGQVRLRDSAGSNSDYLVGNLETYLLQNRNSGELSLQVSRLDQQFGGKHLLAETRLSAQHLWIASGCRPRLGLDASRRDYPTAPQLDGYQLGLHLGLLCASGPWRLDSNLRLAEDRQRNAGRPGGRQEWVEFQLSASWQAASWRIKADTSLGRIRDSEGYSPLLDNNALRQIHRQSLRIELLKPLTPRWDLTLSLEQFRQSSSLQIFELDNHGLYFGARYHY